MYVYVHSVFSKFYVKFVSWRLKRTFGVAKKCDETRRKETKKDKNDRHFIQDY